MRRGFSLVELVIVIAVLLVLSSIASAKLESMRSEAETSACRANLANLATAEHIYATQHGYLTFTGSIGDLEPFLVGASNLRCPSGGTYVLDYDNRGGVMCTWSEEITHGSVASGIKSWE